MFHMVSRPRASPNTATLVQGLFAGDPQAPRSTPSGILGNMTSRLAARTPSGEALRCNSAAIVAEVPRELVRLLCGCGGQMHTLFLISLHVPPTTRFRQCARRCRARGAAQQRKLQRGMVSKTEPRARSREGEGGGGNQGRPSRPGGAGMGRPTLADLSSKLVELGHVWPSSSEAWSRSNPIQPCSARVWLGSTNRNHKRIPRLLQ